MNNRTRSDVFFKSALKFYKKARHGSISERHETDLLIAALNAAYGKRMEASKMFSQIDTTLITDNYRGMGYLALYHAAQGNTHETVVVLKDAHRLNPEQIKTWVAIGDDFHLIESNPEFKTLLQEWKK